MTGEMALLVTVASYGNDFLSGGKDTLDCHTHPSFAHRDIYFKDRIFEIFGKKTTTDAVGWFGYLQQNGCKEIRLFYNVQPGRHESVLINESVRWITETVYADHSDYWICE